MMKAEPMTGRDSLFIFFAALLVFTVGLPKEFIGFQCRFGLFAKEMLWNGPSLFPTIYGQPYPDYPATSTYLVYLLACLFGKVTPFLTILPGTIASALILVFTYRIGAIRNRAWGIHAVIMALFTYEFLADCRAVSLDQYTSLAAVICFWLVYSSSVLGKTGRLWLVPPVLVAGFAFRGPIGLLIPAAVTCSFYIWPTNRRRLIIFGCTAVVLGLICGMAYLAAAKAHGGDSLVESIVHRQAAGRLTDDRVAWYFYLINGLSSYALAYPLALLVIAVAVAPNLKRNDPDYRLLLNLTIWALVIIVGLSLPAVKKMRYLLPAIPAFSLIAAWVFVSDGAGRLLQVARDSLRGFFLWLPVGLCLAMVILVLFGYRFGLKVQPSLVLACVLLFILATASVIIGSHREGAAHRLVMPIALLAFVTFVTGVVEPLRNARNSSRDFCMTVESMRQTKPGPMVFLDIGPDDEDIKYAANLDYELRPDFIRSTSEMTSLDPNAYIVTFARNYTLLPNEVTLNWHIVARGFIGHKECIAFRVSE
jgi:hypothetical protein